MAIAFRQQITQGGFAPGSIGGSFSSAPLNGSLLIAVVSCQREISLISIVESGVTWSLVSSRNGGSTGSSSTRAYIYAAYPTNVSSASTGFTVTFSGSTSYALAFAEFTGVYGNASIKDQYSTAAGGSPPALTGSVLPNTDKQLYIGVLSKNGITYPFGTPTNGYTAYQASGSTSQTAALLYKIASTLGTTSSSSSYVNDSSVWVGMIQTFKEFPADFVLSETNSTVIDQVALEKLPVVVDTDSITVSDQAEAGFDVISAADDSITVSDQLDVFFVHDRAGNDSVAVVDQAERGLEFNPELSDTISVSDQSDLLSVGGIDGHPTAAPITVRMESGGGIALSSVEVEVKLGFDSYRHVFQNERFQIPAGSESALTALDNGWDLSIAPFGFWPRNSAIVVRISADFLPTPYEYSFTTADQAPEIRGVTFIQAAAGTT